MGKPPSPLCAGLVLDGMLVAAMVGRGRELMLGARRDPVFGTVLLVGDGGAQVEVLPDARLLLAPFGVDSVRQAVSQLRIAPLLGGFRGSPARDVEAFCAAAVRLGRWMEEGEELEQVEPRQFRIAQPLRHQRCVQHNDRSFPRARNRVTAPDPLRATVIGTPDAAMAGVKGGMQQRGHGKTMGRAEQKVNEACHPLMLVGCIHCCGPRAPWLAWHRATRQGSWCYDDDQSRRPPRPSPRLQGLAL